MNKVIPFDWRVYPPDIFHDKASALYQKRIYSGPEAKISINVYEYDLTLSSMPHVGYIVEVYIPDVLSPTEMSMKIENYNYTELDWEEFEAHGRRIVSMLCPKLVLA